MCSSGPVGPAKSKRSIHATHPGVINIIIYVLPFRLWAAVRISSAMLSLRSQSLARQIMLSKFVFIRQCATGRMCNMPCYAIRCIPNRHDSLRVCVCLSLSGWLQQQSLPACVGEQESGLAKRFSPPLLLHLDAYNFTFFLAVERLY